MKLQQEITETEEAIRTRRSEIEVRVIYTHFPIIHFLPLCKLSINVAENVLTAHIYYSSYIVPIGRFRPTLL